MCSGFPNGTNGIPISFNVFFLQMVPLVIPFVPMVMPMVTLALPIVQLVLATNGTIGKITNGTIGRTPNRVNVHRDLNERKKNNR